MTRARARGGFGIPIKEPRQERLTAAAPAASARHPGERSACLAAPRGV